MDDFEKYLNEQLKYPDFKQEWNNYELEYQNADTLKAIKDARNGIGLSKGFTSVKNLMDDLDADN